MNVQSSDDAGPPLNATATFRHAVLLFGLQVVVVSRWTPPTAASVVRVFNDFVDSLVVVEGLGLGDDEVVSPVELFGAVLAVPSEPDDDPEELDELVSPLEPCVCVGVGDGVEVDVVELDPVESDVVELDVLGLLVDESVDSVVDVPADAGVAASVDDAVDVPEPESAAFAGTAKPPMVMPSARIGAVIAPITACLLLK